MFILRDILTPLQEQFSASSKGTERGIWFAYTLLAMITHFTSSRTSNLLRCLQALFGIPVCQRRFYTFMASSKLPWQRLWHRMYGRTYVCARHLMRAHLMCARIVRADTRTVGRADTRIIRADT